MITSQAGSEDTTLPSPDGEEGNANDSNETDDNKPKNDKKPEPYKGKVMVAGTEDEKTRKENDRLARLNSGETGNTNLLDLLLMFFFGADEKDLVKGGNAEKISNAFGLDTSRFNQTVSDVISGKTTAFSAAISTVESIGDSKTPDWDKLNDIDIVSLISHNKENILNPYLVDRMNKDPQVAQMVKWTFEAAEREGLDGNLLANQYWAESNFTPDAGSIKGARGVAQFMPEHKGQWGLETDADFFDPKKSIDAGAKFMAHLVNKIGNQHLAMVVYNGRTHALDFVEDNTDQPLTISTWVEFMENRQEDFQTVPELMVRDKDSAWHNETLNYIKRIDPNYWSPELLARAKQQSDMAIAFNNGGVVVADTKQPDPMPFDGKGVDQIATAASIGQNAEVGVKPSTSQAFPT